MVSVGVRPCCAAELSPCCLHQPPAALAKKHKIGQFSAGDFPPPGHEPSATVTGWLGRNVPRLVWNLMCWKDEKLRVRSQGSGESGMLEMLLVMGE